MLSLDWLTLNHFAFQFSIRAKLASKLELPVNRCYLVIAVYWNSFISNYDLLDIRAYLANVFIFGFSHIYSGGLAAIFYQNPVLLLSW